MSCTAKFDLSELDFKDQTYFHLILKMSRQAQRVSGVILLFLLIPLAAFANELTKFETANTPIAEFVSWFATQSGQTIVLGQGVSGSVSFTAPDLKSSEYPAFFNSVLRSHGYQLVKKNSVYVVQLATDAVTQLAPVYVKLYRLEHVRNTKVVDLISSMLAATQNQAIKEQPVQNYNVEVLPTTNALIITGTEQQLAKIDALMKGIDKPQRQVFIEAIITESSVDKSHEVGVNLNAAFKHAGFITNTTIASLMSDNVLVYERGNSSALVKAIDSNENAELLSRPQMLIMDRESGYITVGQNVPFITSTEVTDGGNTINTIERQDVGVSLNVKPHVMGDYVVLEIEQESQSVTNSTQAADIIINKRTLKTVAKVKSRETIVLGGLISTEEKISESGVPLLSDIPLIGWLFGSESLERQQKELRVVIKSTVI